MLLMVLVTSILEHRIIGNQEQVESMVTIMMLPSSMVDVLVLDSVVVMVTVVIVVIVLVEVMELHVITQAVAAYFIVDLPAL